MEQGEACQREVTYEVIIESTDALYDALTEAHSALIHRDDHDGSNHCECQIAELLRALEPEHCQFARKKRKVSGKPGPRRGG